MIVKWFAWKELYVMEPMKKRLPVYMILFYVCIAISLVIWLYVLLASRDSFKENLFTGGKAQTYNEGWVDDNGAPVAIPGRYEVETEEDFRIHHTVSKNMAQDMYLLFQTDHTFVRAYVNEQEIYRFGTASEIPFGSTPGCVWQLVPLGQLSVGDEITLVVNCPYGKYAGQLHSIRIGSKAEHISYILIRGIGFQFLILIPLLIGVLIMLAPLFFRGCQARTFVNIGLSFIVISAWSFTETICWQLFIKNPYAMQTINFVLFGLLAPSVLLALHSMGFLKDSKIYRIMMNVDVAAAFVCLVLQILGVADLVETLPVIHLLLIVNGFIFAGVFFKERELQKSRFALLCVGLYIGILLCSILDLLDFYLWNFFGNGFFARIEIFCLLIGSGFLAMRRGAAMYAENAERRALERMAYSDNLTGLRNRRGYDKDVAELESQGTAVTILYADMNGLKYINDNLGHQYGDNALKVIANQMKESLTKCTCYRMGGDEFCALSTVQDPELLEDICENINERLKAYELAYNYPIGISYGVVKYVPGGEMTLHQCLVAADEKMFAYKQELYKTRKKYR